MGRCGIRSLWMMGARTCRKTVGADNAEESPVHVTFSWEAGRMYFDAELIVNNNGPIPPFHLLKARLKFALGCAEAMHHLGPTRDRSAAAHKNLRNVEW